MRFGHLFVALLLLLAVASRAHAGTVITTADPGYATTLVTSALDGPVGLDFNAGGELFVGVVSGVAKLSFDGSGSLTTLDASFGTTPAGVNGWLAVDSTGRIHISDSRTGSSDRVYTIAPTGGASSVLLALNQPTEVVLTPGPDSLFISKGSSGN